MASRVEPGSRITLHYTLSFADGRVVETTRDTGPATHVLGAGDWLAVLEDRLLGLVAGDSRRFEIGAGEVGAPDAPAPQVLPREEFPPEIRLKPGLVVGFTLPSGEEVAGTVREATAREVTVDFTHPLAGRALVWEVEILEVKPPKGR